MFSKMPWASHEEHASGPEKEESLTSILATTQDRTELTLLVANCTETMRQQIVDTFDAKQTGQEADLKADIGGDKAWVQSVKADIAAQEKAQKEHAAREKELSTPKMQETKKAALKHFDEWRDSVLQRVGEVVNSREIAQEQKHEAKSHAPVPPSKRQSAPAQYDQSIDASAKEVYLPSETSLVKLQKEKKALILHSLLLLLLSLEHYSAYSRVLLLHITTSLQLSVTFLADDESKIARGLLAAADMKAEEETKKKAEENAGSRKWKVGLATVAGAAVIGITGGLAAPLLAAGVGSVMGGLGLGATATAGYLGSMASSTLLVGGLFGAYGGKMTGKMMDQYAREVEDFAFIPIRTYHKPRKIEKEFRRLRVAIGISGWLTEKDEVVVPWKVLGTSMESFALRYELESLLALGNALTTMLSSAAWGYAKSEIIKRTVFASLTAALWPIGLLKISRIVDNPFSVAKARADKAGEVLADAIINKAQGERPVTLVGYSLGARVIFVCMKRLAERKAFGLVESVVLLGAPTPSSAADWRMVRSVVSGRVINVYSTSDYILGFLYRSSSIQYGVAGLQAIQGVKGVQNLDVTETVTGHTMYRYLVGSILKTLGFEDVDEAALQKQEEEYKEAHKQEEAEQKESEQKEQQQQKTAAAAADGSNVSDEQVKDLEKKVELKNQETMISWATEKMQLGGATAATAAAKAKAWYTMRGLPSAGGGVKQPNIDVSSQVDAPKDIKAPALSEEVDVDVDVAKKEALDAEKAGNMMPPVP